MIPNNGVPYHLPQVHAKLEYVLTKLKESNIDFEIVEVNPNELTPSQGLVYSDITADVSNDQENPIWISKDNHILDGHHRYVKALMNEEFLKCVMIDLGERDACRALNKIQDIYEFEEQQQTEMFTFNETTGGEDDKFLKSLELKNSQIEDKSVNPETIIGYRKEPINEKSLVGNFFYLKPVEGYTKYEIEFENLLNTNNMGITFKSGQIPVDVLSKIWFPNVNFEKLGDEYGLSPTNLQNKAIANKAKMLGYDGIKYGETLIQGI